MKLSTLFLALSAVEAGKKDKTEEIWNDKGEVTRQKKYSRDCEIRVS